MATVTQQQITIGEGLAVGCISIGKPGFNGDIEMAFNRAWISWGHSGLFPNVRGTVGHSSIFIILSMSSRRKTPVVAWWTGGGRAWSARLDDDYVIADAVDWLAMYDSKLTLSAWEELASEFTKYT